MVYSKKIDALEKFVTVGQIWKFEKFYEAEERHQNFYKVYFQNYLRYKKACKREETLNEIWN